jgi:hypothetical protein
MFTLPPDAGEGKKIPAATTLPTNYNEGQIKNVIFNNDTSTQNICSEERYAENRTVTITAVLCTVPEQKNRLDLRNYLSFVRRCCSAFVSG